MKIKTRKVIGRIILVLVSLPVIAVWVYGAMQATWLDLMAGLSILVLAGLTLLGLYLIREDFEV